MEDSPGENIFTEKERTGIIIMGHCDPLPTVPYVSKVSKETSKEDKKKEEEDYMVSKRIIRDLEGMIRYLVHNSGDLEDLSDAQLREITENSKILYKVALLVKKTREEHTNEGGEVNDKV